MLANPGLFKRSRLQWLMNTAALKLPFTNSDTIDSRITATRASTKTYFDSTGTLQTAAIDAFPLEYDPSTLKCLGRSFWEARTNLLTYSQEFDNASWTKTRSSITANATTAPDGTLTADKLVEDTTATNTHFAEQSTTNANATYTYSVWVKAAERSTAFVGMSDGVTALIGCFINMTTGTTTISTGGSWTGVSVSSVSHSNGWWRVVVTATRGAGTATLSRVYVTNGTVTTTYTGDGASGIYIWGAQLETGATPTPYIPTTSAAVTRSADVVSMTGTNFSSWYNQTEGTFLATSICTGVASGGFPRILEITDGTTNNRFTNQFYSTVINRLSVINGGVNQAGFDATTSGTANVVGTSVFCYKVNDFALGYKGDAITTDTSGTLPTVNQLGIGMSFSAVSQLNGWISRITYWNRRLSNADLQILSRST